MGFLVTVWRGLGHGVEGEMEGAGVVGSDVEGGGVLGSDVERRGVVASDIEGGGVVASDIEGASVVLCEFERGEVAFDGVVAAAAALKRRTGVVGGVGRSELGSEVVVRGDSVTG